MARLYGQILCASLTKVSASSRDSLLDSSDSKGTWRRTASCLIFDELCTAPEDSTHLEASLFCRVSNDYFGLDLSVLTEGLADEIVA